MRSAHTLDWKLDIRAAFAAVIAAAMVFAAMRATGTLGPKTLQFLLPLGFTLMALAPWALLTREGRVAMGLRKPARAAVYLPAVSLGALASLVCFGVGVLLFGAGVDNWFATIAANFDRNVPDHLPVWQLFLMFTATSMIFSPIGEEIFFRGLLQKTLETKFSPSTSTWVECVAFGLVHLCHHGILLGAAGLEFLPKSAPIWFALMVAAGYLFARLRAKSQSLYPAIAAHMAFNLVMGICIFAALWPAGS